MSEDLTNPSDDNVEAYVWKTPSERPADYPEDLPFFAGRTVGVTVVREPRGISARWEDVEDTDAFIAELISACVEDGWELVAPSREIDVASTRLMALERRGRQRVIMATSLDSGDVVSLAEGRARSSSDAD